jgi:hypothetical protein
MLKLQRSKTAVVKDAKERKEMTVKKHVDILAEGETEEVLILNKGLDNQDQEETAANSHYVNIVTKFNWSLGI